MMKKTMKKMVALTMAGMMAMSINTGAVSVLAAETDEYVGGGSGRNHQLLYFCQ